jgi:hypothetical protein
LREITAQIREIQEAAMEIRSLPQYRGLADSANHRAEPDDRGQIPGVRLRDWVLLSVLIILALQICAFLAVRIWTNHAYAEAQNAAREQQAGAAAALSERSASSAAIISGILHGVSALLAALIVLYVFWRCMDALLPSPERRTVNDDCFPATNCFSRQR